MMSTLEDKIRNAAAADLFKQIATPEQERALAKRIASIPDPMLELFAKAMVIPDHQIPIYKQLIRKEDNEFMRRFIAFDGVLHSGDILLMTGKSNSSKALVKIQKTFYDKARSSHVAVVHADHICIDAMPEIGVSNRLLHDVLADAENDWRVIRFNGFKDEHREPMLKRCVYYIAQPYSIFPSKKPAQNFSYCSELARKVYVDLGITNTEIPSGRIIKPCDFDRIADSAYGWVDVTASVQPFLAFCREFNAFMPMTCKLFIDGLKLNRQRYADRDQAKVEIELKVEQGTISREAADTMLAKIKEAEDKLNFDFWDYRVPKPQTAGNKK